MIALSFALPEESKGIVRGLTGARRSGPGALPIIAGTLAGREVVIVHSGMGMDSATARIAGFLENHAPSHWIASGFGGGLSHDLRIGDIVAVHNFSDVALLRAIASLPARPGVLITTRDVIETAEKKKDLARHTGATVVDMETAAIFRLCEARGIPLLAVRAISDTAGQDLPVPAGIWFNTVTQRPRPIRLVLHLATHPGRIAPFFRFVRGIGRARARLTPFLLAALAALPEK
jgi:adenosylhomocysteine nucleosidase